MLYHSHMTVIYGVFWDISMELEDDDHGFDALSMLYRCYIPSNCMLSGFGCQFFGPSLASGGCFMWFGHTRQHLRDAERVRR